MRKLILISLTLLIVSIPTFAGGIITNTNQHVSFLRMLARGASIDIDGVYSNPAGLAFLDEGFYLAVNAQSAYQTRVIDATFPLFTEPNNTRRYKGTASAPFVPSFQAAYKRGDWVFSGSFAVTGGGGKASFSSGLPMFDARVMTGLAADKTLQGLAASVGKKVSDLYTISSSMDGKQYIFGVQLGMTYKITDYLSVFGGGRMNYVSGGYEGYLDAKLKPEYGDKPLAQIGLDCDQSGWGVTPIIGADVKLGKFNVGLKYEFITSLNIENKTRKNTDPDGALADYKNGVNTPNDIPALFTAALGYELLPTLRATIEYHNFADKQAGMSLGKQKTLTSGTHEYLIGAEWDVTKRVSLSGGYQKTDYGLSADFQSDVSFYCDSYAVGFGTAIKLNPKLKLNLAYYWTTYADFTKDVAAGTPGSGGYNGTGMAGKDVYSRTNKAFGVGFDYKF